jgi:hypothetical protein
VTEFLNKMFGFDALKLGDPDVTLDWTRPVPAWGWLLIVLAAGILSAWSYRKLDGPRWPRGILAGLRGLLLVVIAVLLSGPRLAKQNQTVERDWVVVLADRSASMMVRDAPGPGGVTRTRDEQLRAALAGADEAWEAAARDRKLLWLTFDAGASTLRAPADRARPELPVASGRATDLSSALSQAARLTAARPVAGMVLLSDGRTTTPPSEDLLAQLKGRQIPVLAVALGNATAQADLSVERTEAPSAAFVNDTVPVSVTVSRSQGERPRDIKVRLIDSATGATLDEQPVEFVESGDEARVVLTSKPSKPGSATWVVKIVGPEPDIVPGNDSAEVAISLIDRPLRVAYFDGYPRWEYRYLKNLLVRERTINSSISLLAAQRKFIQEGSNPLLFLPRTPQEWRQFDVVILGDLRPEMFSRDQLTMLRDHVSKNGGGVLMIGGPGPMPNAWRGSPAADLIPFTLGTGDSAAPVSAWLEPVIMNPTEVADRLGLLRLADDPKESWPAVLRSPDAGWTALRLAQRIDAQRLKPAAEVIATATPLSKLSADTGAGTGEPLVVTMRYGAGRVVYVATDEIWRWRYGRGETLPERFWLPIIRMLARQGLETSGQPAVLTASPPRAQVDRPVQVSVRLVDQSLLDARPSSVRVRARPKAAADGVAPTSGDLGLVLSPQVDTAGGGEAPNVFAVTWLPTEPGTYTLTIDDPLLPPGLPGQEVVVAYPDDELRSPQTDHALMGQIASQTGGRVVEPEKLSEALSQLPDRQIRLVGAPTIETLWDKPFVWVLLMVILAMEWVGRRVIRLP